MSELRPGYVQTVYGPLPGCPECDVIPLTAPHICEHGVTPAPYFEFSFTTTWSTTDDETAENGSNEAANG